MIKEIIPFDQNEIETKIKSILLNKGFKDIVYPGSNISQISDIMSYLIYVLNTNTALNLQEVLLPLASKRTNVLFAARQLGYEATQKTSYQYKLKVDIKYNTEVSSDNEVYTIEIPKYTKFKSNENYYYYLGDTITIETTNNNRFNDGVEIIVKEGILTKYDENELLQFRAHTIVDEDGNIVTKQNYLLPFKNIEENGIEVYLTYVDDYGSDIIREKWEKSDQFLMDSAYSYNKQKYIRLQNLFLDMPSIFFEIGGYGNPVRLNTLIECNILQTNGKNGYAGDVFTIEDETLSNQISLSIGEIIHYGTDEESIESIKQSAPIFHNSANRAVTALDYVSISQRHENVKFADVWGIENEYGEENSFASVFFSFIPERLERNFLSVNPDNNYGEENENYAKNTFFKLQKTPRYPKLEKLLNPDDDPTSYPVTNPPTNPNWMPRPSNWMEEPDGWDEDNPTSEPLQLVSNPGENPGSVKCDGLCSRDSYIQANSVSGNSLPSDWVENPNIYADYVITGSTQSVTVNQNEYVYIEKSGTGSEFNAIIGKVYRALNTFTIDLNNEDFTNTNNWIEDIYNGIDTTQTENQLIAYNIYKNNTSSTWTEEFENLDKEWFNQGTVQEDEYKTFLNDQDTINYINWRRDYTIYQKYLYDLDTWNTLKEEYNDYITYLESDEGSVYVNYWNSFDQYGDTDYVIQRQEDDINYNNYLTAIDNYNDYKTDLQLLENNWYLNDENDVYKMQVPPPYPLRDNNVFTMLESYKIMTMKHNHRKPVYMDFDYFIKITKYDLSNTYSKTNKDIFNIINNYFKNYIEVFNTEYFHSNLQRRIDESLGETNGVELNLTNKIVLNKNMYDNFYIERHAQKEILIKLAFPFENLYEDGLNLTNERFLPIIDTENFSLQYPNYITTGNEQIVNIEDGDYVYYKVAGLNGVVVNYYKALTQQLNIDLNNTDFTDVNNWKQDVGQPKDIYCKHDITYNTTGSTQNVYLYENDYVYYENQTSGTGTLGTYYRSGIEGNYDLNTIDFSTWEIVNEEDVNTGYKIPINSKNLDENIPLNIYYGDITDNGENDPIVGKYTIRNKHNNFIEVRLFFDVETQAILPFDDIAYSNPPIGLLEDDIFQDFGYAYMNIVYPSNLNSSSQNIPFFGNTIPRLNSVKFKD